MPALPHGKARSNGGLEVMQLGQIYHMAMQNSQEDWRACK